MDAFRCCDCKVDTLAGREYYMLTQKTWKQTGLKAGILCIGCVEKRMGRELRPRDFTSAPINAIFPPSDRLQARRGPAKAAFKRALELLRKQGMPRPKGYTYVVEDGELWETAP